MPDDVDSIGLLVGHDRDARVPLDGARKIHEPAVDAPGERRLGEARPDRGRDLADRDCALERPATAVG